MPLNINIDPSSAPSWVLPLLVAATLAAEVLDDPQPSTGLDPEECWTLCVGEVGSWNPYHCECRPDVGEETER